MYLERNKIISKSKKFFLNTCCFSKNDLATKLAMKYWNVDYARLLSPNIEASLESRLNNGQSFRVVTKVLFAPEPRYWTASILPPSSPHIIRFLHFFIILFTWNMHNICRSQWPRGLRRRSTVARLLRSWVRIPPRAWMFVCCECCVSGRGLCDELIIRSEESYRLWRVVVCDQETLQARRLKSARGL